MTIETLEIANEIKETIDELEAKKSRTSKLYSKKENLTAEEIEEILQIAMENTDFTLKSFKDEFAKL